MKTVKIQAATTVTRGWPTLFPTLEITDEDINKFLESCELYDDKMSRWREIPVPSSVNTDSEPLRGAFQAIYNEVLEYFFKGSRTKQWVVETHRTIMEDRKEVTFVDCGGDPVEVRPAPDFCVLGTSPMLPGATSAQPASVYANCVAPILVVRKVAISCFEMAIANLFTFAWQCFANQPHRRFVLSMIITDWKTHMISFDRHGNCQTKCIDTHSEATDLVRILLGLVTDRSEVVGFDPLFSYDKRGGRSILFSNCLNTPRSDIKKPTKLKVVDLLPNRSSSIEGKGTVCWDVRLPSKPKKRLVLKDYWAPASMTSEAVIMKALVGLPGVAQIVGWDNDPSLTISAQREHIFAHGSASVPENKELVFTRILCEGYGEPLENFKSPMHLLCAFRDVVVGHSHMWSVGVLHRDISANNILYGVAGAPEGERGKVIDFDMATFVASADTKRLRVGTRPFHSLMLLAPAHRRQSQDHQDDLESFFYVLLYICCQYDGPGNPLPDYPSIFTEFNCDNNLRAHSHKHRVLSGATTIASLVTPFWKSNPVMVRLLQDLASLFNKIYIAKAKLRGVYARKVAKSSRSEPNDSTLDEKILEELPTLSEIHKADLESDPLGRTHRAVAGLVDAAIVGLEYMEESERIKQQTKALKLASEVLTEATAPKLREKRVRSSMDEVTNTPVKQKRRMEDKAEAEATTAQKENVVA